MKIRLVKNGVFPITKDKNGNAVEEKPQTGFDVAGTFQGEGKLLGTPVLFIRLSGCNLRCTWKAFDGSIDICDTPYSSHHPDDYDEWEIEDVVATVKQNLGEIKHIVISGGEPTLQSLQMIELCRELKKLNLHITMETNGVLFYAQLVKYIDLISISPKLKASIPTKEKIAQMNNPINNILGEQHEKIRLNIDSLQKYINTCYAKDTYYSDVPDAPLKRREGKDFQFKFVISNPEEEQEIRANYIDQLENLNNDDIILMPLGSSKAYLEKTFVMTAEMAVRNHWRFTPRLHIDLFDNTQYV